MDNNTGKTSGTESNVQADRREFIKKSAAAAAGFMIVPSHVVAGLGHKAPSDKLNIAGIGIGGRGFGNLKEMESENIVALCDVDWKYSERVFDHYPKANRFKDWRVMFDEMHKTIDAVMISTPDHTHAGPAAHAITLGKHVYLQKPLTHTVYESRLLASLAKHYKVATSMGNQGSSLDGTSDIIEWIHNGEIGEVTKVEAYTDRPIWPQGMNTPTEVMPVPDYLDWDLFIGPAETRPYNDVYAPWNWRGWWDFGTGALGDMACHVLHPAFIGLHLGHPSKVQGSSSNFTDDSAPQAQHIRLTFPARRAPRGMKVDLPEVELFWYDGGLRPMRPDGWPPGKDATVKGGGIFFHGTKDSLISGSQGRQPWLLSGRVPDAPKFRRRIATTHEADWIRACKESPGSRTPTASDFSEAGPFNELVVMGVLAVRLQGLHKELEWDGKKMEFTNISENDQLQNVIRDGFEIIDGHPKFAKELSDPINAKEFTSELIRHSYRAPWTLPDMPKS